MMQKDKILLKKHRDGINKWNAFVMRSERKWHAILLGAGQPCKHRRKHYDTIFDPTPSMRKTMRKNCLVN